LRARWECIDEVAHRGETKSKERTGDDVGVRVGQREQYGLTRKAELGNEKEKEKDRVKGRTTKESRKNTKRSKKGDPERAKGKTEERSEEVEE